MKRIEEANSPNKMVNRDGEAFFPDSYGDATVFYVAHQAWFVNPVEAARFFGVILADIQPMKEWRSDQTIEQKVELILVGHQRYSHRGCLCGWSELGRSHAEHQAAMLRAAGLLCGEAGSDR